MSAPGHLDIVVKQVSVRRGETWVLRDICWHLRAGERWALVGANGAGKTQLLKLLATDVWPTPLGRESLVFMLDGSPVAASHVKPRIAYLGAEAQDKYSRHGWDLPVADIVASGVHGTDLLLSPVTPRERRRVDAALRACDLGRLAARPFLSLSYGQKRLALLARATVGRPDWLLLDELYNGLDRAYRMRIDELIRQARRRGQSWVISAHRPEDVPRGTTRLLELHAGRILRTAPLRRAALAGLVAPVVTARQRGVEPSRRPRGKALVRLVDADVYVNYRPVLRHLDWQLHAGEHWAVTGPNGSGKSSFLKLLYGDLWPADGGHIVRRDVPPGTPIELWKQRVGFVSPELQTDYLIDTSLVDLVASGRHASIGLVAAPDAADVRRARRWLSFFGLARLHQRRPRELSYGELRRALLARALAANPRLLLLDEPLTGLDPTQRASIRGLLERLMNGSATIVMAVHHPEDLPRGISRRLHLSRRRARVVEPTLRRFA